MNGPRTIVIAGASGYLGRHLHQAWTSRGDTVRTIGRGLLALNHGRPLPSSP